MTLETTRMSFETPADSEEPMRIDIRQKSARRDFSTQTLRDLIERQLGFALGRFGGRISRVSLFFEDLNGPRGGMDLECRAWLKFADWETSWSSCTTATWKRWCIELLSDLGK